MSLGSLNTDVLLRIFFFTNVATIISLSRVNQYFRTISLTKHLWISVVRDLGERGLVEALPENLKALSTEELIDEVKRAVFGPRTWSPVSVESPKMLLQFEILCARRPEDIELLPGGKHILFYVYPQPGGPRGIECWEVRTGLRRWSWSHANYSANHAVFHFRGASKATVAVVCELGKALLVLEADLRTGESRELVHLANKVEIPYYTVQISNDFIVCKVTSIRDSVTLNRKNLLMIVNWRAAEFILLDFGNPRPVAMALLPGHLILGYHTITDRTFNLDIQLYPAASFDGGWHPLGGFGTDLCIDPSEIASLPVPIALGPLSRAVRLCITKNPLRDYTLMVECHSDFPAPITLSLFLLTLRPSPEPLLSPLPQASLKYISRHAFLKSGRTSAAGYSMAWNADYSRVLVYPPDEERGVRYESDAMFAPVMTYTPHPHGPEIQSRELPIEDVDDVTKVFLSDSGAVIARYDGRVVVSYYV